MRGFLGAEPSTPSLPWNSQASGGSPRQRFWLVVAGSARSRFAADCHRLQPRGSIKAPSFIVRVGYVAAGRPLEYRSARGILGLAHTRSLSFRLLSLRVEEREPESLRGQPASGRRLLRALEVSRPEAGNAMRREYRCADASFHPRPLHDSR